MTQANSTATDKTATGKTDNAGIMRGLAQLDERIREAQFAGAPKGTEKAPEGAGLYSLLEIVASQFMGVPPAGFPVEQPGGATKAGPSTGEPPAAAGAEHVEAGSLSAQAIEAGSEGASEGHHEAGGKTAGKDLHDAGKHRR